MRYFSNSKAGETLASVIIGVVILVIAIAGVMAIFLQNSAIDEEYAKKNDISIMKLNSENIIRKINTDALADKEVFYIYKDPVSRSVQIFTGSANMGYKYVNRDGEVISNTGLYPGNIFMQSFTIERGNSGFGAPKLIIKSQIKEYIRK